MATALLSVYNKDGIIDFARQLKELDWEIIASGGTAKELAKAGIFVGDVALLVGGGAILGHRVVTLSREIHAGLLARDTEDDRRELQRLGIPRIDLVCVDLYPLQEEVQNPNCTRESVIEKTDIGGPTLLRSAAKGRRIVICDPHDYQKVIDWLKQGKPNEEAVITALAAKAEAKVAEYCLTSARYHSGGEFDGLIVQQVIECKYGENAWQNPAGLFSTNSGDPLALDKFELVAGTQPSYNKLCDTDRLLQTITHIAAAFGAAVPPIAVGVKHGNPCGAAVGSDYTEVLKNMIYGDVRAIFGGVVMTNFMVNEEAAEILLNHLMDHGRHRLLDGIIAPYFSDEAVEMLKRKGDKCRLLANPALLCELYKNPLDFAPRFRGVRGGFLRQPNYTFVPDLDNPGVEKTGGLTKEQENNLLLAWAIGSTSNSNTITLVRDLHLIGNGVGQQDRVSCCKLAVNRAREAGHQIAGAVAYSDSFFPFIDGPQVLAEAGVKTILASSGSVHDQEVKQFCQENGITLYLSPDKIGRGFFGH